ncbi:HAD family hydrolase [Pseudooceanicola sp.]|uniref:HAD family hydrolase n=1 Tax=Pseudooceanicola sp. TaxID=1914328 RepID=UPI00260DB3D2|nr:HAD family hydrolase [Pseudooceanicola sp.]MDF1854851.1 HAD family hydrolase [Pseudooceanicola sp.]
MKVDAILFDKDGTLFDFAATWNVWAGAIITETAGGDVATAQRVADALRYDLGAASFRPDSPVIAGTNRDAAELIVSALPDWSLEAMEELLMQRAAAVPQMPAIELVPFLDGLRARGLALGVMTNDTEFAARAHLDRAGVLDQFDMVIGFDSGYGAKPDAAPLLAFANAQGHAPGRVAMVGDSTHDLIAGRAAGMICIGVLTGPARAKELAPFADQVFPDIGHLADWLDPA